ncbi:WhiB family transcriptional regulator [Streptomyces sp. NPDC056632]|uniref:WhiB family transcriptional regulator n=1 Tax=Streptomyces sp. NPDC056632 TaxID=3345884 RepID=UPI0036B4F79C
MTDATSTRKILIPAFLFHVDKPVPCTYMPGLFHPPDDAYRAREEPGGERAGLARALCRPCPVLADCRTWARDRKEWGIWGGETDSERCAAVRPERGRRPARSAASRSAPRPGVHAAERHDAERPPSLTDKQWEVLELLAAGTEREDIRLALGLTRQSVAGVINSLGRKLGTDWSGIVAAARSAGLLPTHATTAATVVRPR